VALAGRATRLLAITQKQNQGHPVKRLAVVVQRYGEKINGGAELHARLLTERLAQHYDVEVLTSCAHDYTDWAMVYPAGPSLVNGVRVLRFPHPLRNDVGRARVPLLHKLRFKLRRLLGLLPGARVQAPNGDPLHDGVDFLRKQGPHCEALFQHLTDSVDRYDAVIFYTALYEPSARGVQVWGRRSILLPLLHDEKPMYLPVFGTVLRSAGALIFQTEAERVLAAHMYGIDTRKAVVAALGMEVPVPDAAAVAEALTRYGLKPGYLIYVGRIDVAKGCDELLDVFQAHARSDPSARLVMVGQAIMQIPEDPRIVRTGFISEADRNALIAGAAALVIPSRYESLSMVLLEAMLLGTPVIANGRCGVLAEHVQNSGAGLAYRSQRQLHAALREMSALTAAERSRLGARGAAYVQRLYTWPHVLRQYAEAIELVSRNAPAADHTRVSTTS
jgi:glycosyltransferase involved in cell wall biosynthesis